MCQSVHGYVLVLVPVWEYYSLLRSPNFFSCPLKFPESNPERNLFELCTRIEQIFVFKGSSSSEGLKFDELFFFRLDLIYGQNSQFFLIISGTMTCPAERRPFFDLKQALLPSLLTYLQSLCDKTRGIKKGKCAKPTKRPTATETKSHTLLSTIGAWTP